MSNKYTSVYDWLKYIKANVVGINLRELRIKLITWQCCIELMSQDEIAVMDGGKCIMQLRGVRPFFSNKFDITKHKQYRLLSDFDDKNALDIEKYVKNLCKARVRDNDTVDEVEDAGVIEVWQLNMEKTE